MEGVHVEAYLGVPFAEPPINELRFRPPQPLKRVWEDGRRFSEVRSGCYTGKEGTSEDCLYLNVYRPQNVRVSESLPVMVWIYGGGFSSGKVDLYNGTELAARNGVVVVVPAYRLGAFGFLASQSTYTESGTTGNWGFLDQQFALKWVRENIASFQGDPSRVVLFGQSAGAISIAAHLVSRDSQGLFSGAILSSPTTSSDFFFQDRSDSTRFSSWAAKSLARCSSLDDLVCMRSVPASRLVVSDGHRDDDSPDWASRLFPSMPWGLTIDGSTLEGKPLDLARQGLAAKVPVIIGITEDEGSLFSLGLNKFIRPSFKGDIPASLMFNITEYLVGNASFATELMREFALSEPGSVVREMPAPSPASATSPSQLKQEFLNLGSRDISAMTSTDVLQIVPSLRTYNQNSLGGPLPYDKAPFDFFTTALKDCLFSCSSLAFAEALKSHGNSVWFYNFDLDVWADTPWGLASTSALAPGGTNMTVAELGAFHGAELPFIFNLFPDEETTPNDLTNPSMLFKGFTGKQFCPANSFKRTVANQIGCMWTNMAKCGEPQCESDCGITTVWESFGTTRSVLNIQNRGEYEMKSVGPQENTCAKWIDLKIPFYKFSKDVIISPKEVFSADSNANSANSYSMVVLLCAILFLLHLLG